MRYRPSTTQGSWRGTVGIGTWGCQQEVDALSDTMQQVLIRMPPDLYNALKQHAEVEDRTIAAEVRRAVRRYLAEPQPAR